MHITADDIQNEISFDNPIDNRNGNKKGRTNPHLLRFQIL